MSHFPSAHVTLSLHSELLLTLLVIGTHLYYSITNMYYTIQFHSKLSCLHVNVRCSGGIAWVNGLRIVVGVGNVVVVGNVQGNWIIKLNVLF